MGTIALTLTALCLTAAPFEGTLHATLKTPAGNGTIATAISEAGVRSDANLQLGGPPLQSSVLLRADRPDVALARAEAGGEWRELPLSTDPRGLSPMKGTRVGEEKVAGLPCQHVRLSDDTGAQMDLWTTRALGLSPKLEALLLRAQQLPPPLEQALTKLGAQGVVMKMVSERGGTRELTLEVERVDRSKPAASLFAVSAPAAAPARSPAPPGTGGKPSSPPPGRPGAPAASHGTATAVRDGGSP